MARLQAGTTSIPESGDAPTRITSVVPIGRGMVLWVPLPAGIPSAPFTRKVLEEAGVVLLPGSGFGPSGEGFFRIALTLPSARIAEGIARVGAMLAKA